MMNLDLAIALMLLCAMFGALVGFAIGRWVR